MLPNTSGPDVPLRQRKETGAFYTPTALVRHLVRWATEISPNRILDPACGDGRFLLEAAGPVPDLHLTGVDVDAGALAAAAENLHLYEDNLSLLDSDFFAVSPSELQPVDAIVGNPPFVRYQQFKGRSRQLALESALSQGVRLSRLTSSWAPFVLHAMRFLRPGGRLGMVVPAEITQTRYGLRTLRAVAERFGRVRLVAFEQNGFSDAQVGICLLMAQDLGSETRKIELIPVSSEESLPELREGSEPGGVSVPVYSETLARFAEAYLRKTERNAWRRSLNHPQSRSLASLASVTNGYVTGDNQFFHRTKTEAQESGLPARWLWPVARSSKSFRGVFWTDEDLAEQEEAGHAHHLVVPREDLFLEAEKDRLAAWLAEGKARNTHERFKCRKRSPWWRVPNVQSADILVGYMAGAYPRAVLNDLKAAYSNSLHGLRVHDERHSLPIVLGLYSSLGLLSLEIEGRSYGGGVLKIEPRELGRVVVPLPDLPLTRIQDLAQRADQALREDDYYSATREIDEVLLEEGLGMSAKEVALLRAARERLVQRRMGRPKTRN